MTTLIREPAVVLCLWHCLCRRPFHHRRVPLGSGRRRAVGCVARDTAAAAHRHHRQDGLDHAAGRERAQQAIQEGNSRHLLLRYRRDGVTAASYGRCQWVEAVAAVPSMPRRITATNSGWVACFFQQEAVLFVMLLHARAATASFTHAWLGSLSACVFVS